MGEPVRSMTGFGAGYCKAQDFQVAVEVRSVNHRFLKVSSRVPEDHSGLQERIESRLRQVMGRGAINVVVQIERTSQAAQLELDTELLRKLYRELQELGRDLGATAPLGLADLLCLEGVVRPVHAAAASEPAELLAAVDNALTEAIGQLQGMQLREGEHLLAELVRILDLIAGGLASVEAERPGVARENRERYQRRLQEFLQESGVEVQPADLLREVAILAEKADITEETSRLGGHVEQYREAITRGGRVGRKLDFLTQEMLREANTMAAKTNHFQLARLVVELKTEVDRLREQTQNVE